MKKRYLVMALVCLIGLACSEFGLPVDLSLFRELDEMDDVDLSLLKPERGDVGYIELREAYMWRMAEDDEQWPKIETDEEEPYWVVTSGGELCEGAQDSQDCSREFEQLDASTGFCMHNHPGDSIYYLAVNDGDENRTITSIEGVIDFLGAIDTEEEALLLARANCYFWDEAHVKNGGIREVEDGYELIATQLVSLCTPLQTDRVWIHVSEDGSITELGREVLEKLRDMCS